MNGKNATVSVGIYQSGASIRVIGECDLTTQDAGHKEEAIYILESSLQRDPSKPLSEKEIVSMVATIEAQFKQHKYDTKVTTRLMADAFIKSKVGGPSWIALKAI